MKYFLLISSVIATLTGTAIAADEPYSKTMDVVDRTNNVRKMVAPDMEYIASTSYTTVQVTYNVFLHKELAQDAGMPDLDPERILAEERMTSESAALCNNHFRANECIVFLWKNMSLIPPGDKNFQRYGAIGADGVFRIVKGEDGRFSWRHESQKSQSQSLIEHTSDEDQDAYAPYQRDVRASHRFLEGAKMVGEDMEFISVESVMRMHMLYHVYLHPRKMRIMQTDDLSDDRLRAEKDIVMESLNLCRRYEKADECSVLLWGRLEDIPLNEKNINYDDLRTKASGYYMRGKGLEPVFRWKNGD